MRERHNITTLVDRLKRDGLVTVERNDRDGRSVNIVLTDEGQRVLSRVTPVANEIVNQVMLSITEDDDAVVLEKLMGVLRQNTDDGLKAPAL